MPGFFGLADRALTASVVTGPTRCAIQISAPSKKMFSEPNPSIKVTQDPPASVPLLSPRPSSMDSSAIPTATAIASAVHPVTPAIPGRSAGRTTGFPGCSHAKQPEQTSPAIAGTSRYTTRPRSFSTNVPLAGPAPDVPMDGVSRASRQT